MEDYVVLDTNVASRLYKHQGLPSNVLEALAGLPTAVSFATIGEMTEWADSGNWGPQAQKDLERWLSTHRRIDGDETVAHCWGHLSAASRRRGRPVDDNDTWIAACCLTMDAPLATLNTKDFVGFAGHHGLQLVDETRKER